MTDVGGEERGTVRVRDVWRLERTMSYRGRGSITRNTCTEWSRVY